MQTFFRPNEKFIGYHQPGPVNLCEDRPDTFEADCDFEIIIPRVFIIEESSISLISRQAQVNIELF